MSHPAVYVVVESGEARASVDRHGALGNVGTFADGPEAVRKAWDAARSTGRVRRIDRLEGDGGCLVDFDTKVAMVFGVLERPNVPPPVAAVLGPEFVQRQRDLFAAYSRGEEGFFAAIAARWPGWDLRWGNAERMREHLEARGLAL